MQRNPYKYFFFQLFYKAQKFKKEALLPMKPSNAEMITIRDNAW